MTSQCLRRVVGGSAAAVALAVLIGGCSGGSMVPQPITPTPTPTPTPPPVPTIVNTPPTIASVTPTSPRVEADQTVDVTVDVQDAETPVDQLTYEWSAAPSAGVFTGSGRTVTWRAPHLQTTPDLYTITVTVTEKFTEGGVAKEFKVASTVPIHYNDSYRDVNRLATDFLVDKFGNYNVTPQQSVSNFSDSCPGKASELSDVQANRQFFQILSATFSGATVTFNRSMTEGAVVGRCEFEDITKATGKKQRVTGVCTLTTVYENWQWFLCDSSFSLTGSVPLGGLRFRAPGAR
jgi:hypothetical protein